MNKRIFRTLTALLLAALFAVESQTTKPDTQVSKILRVQYLDAPVEVVDPYTFFGMASSHVGAP